MEKIKVEQSRFQNRSEKYLYFLPILTSYSLCGELLIEFKIIKEKKSDLLPYRNLTLGFKF